jgi:hypothetical protein
VDDQLAHLKESGLSEKTSSSLHDYYAARLDGPLGSGQYGRQAKEIYDQIVKTLRAYLPVAMSTRSWGTTPGTGQSGENIQLVAGLASDHE